MNEQLVSQVEDLGLSNKEARVYVASLMLGPSPVQKIADFAGIKRVTTYVILESLGGLGLVSQTSKGKKTLFAAEDPANLERLLEKKAQELKDQQTNFKAILPELKGLESLPPDSPEVRFFQGIEAIKSVRDHYMPQMFGDKVVTAFSNLDLVFKYFPEIKEARANPQRLKSGIRSRMVYTYSGGPILEATDKERNRESRHLPADRFPLSIDVSVAGEYVIIYDLQSQRPMAITIKSREVAKTFRIIFDLAWEAAEKYVK